MIQNVERVLFRRPLLSVARLNPARPSAMPKALSPTRFLSSGSYIFNRSSGVYTTNGPAADPLLPAYLCADSPRYRLGFSFSAAAQVSISLLELAISSNLASVSGGSPVG